MTGKSVIGIIGLGAMGGAIARRLMDSFASDQLIGFDRNPDRAGVIGIRQATTAKDLCLTAGAILIAVKPQQLPEIINEISPIGDKLLISIAAGIPLARLNSFGTARIVRAMPNLAAVAGQSMTGWVTSSEITTQDRELTERIFNAIGAQIELTNESQIDALTAVAGSGPGYLMAVAEALTAAAIEVGFTPDQAALIVRQTLVGAGALLASDDRSFAQLKAAVTSKGGTTEAGLAAMPESELAHIVGRAVSAAHDRAQALGK